MRRIAFAPQTRLLLAGLVVLLLTWLAYRPGLSAGFLFDDFVNLDALGRYGVVDNWAVFWRYITSGTADPIGRPLALLSFLIDARDWPADPTGFLRTNVFLHMLNGALLFVLLRNLGRSIKAVESSGAADWAALVSAAWWLLHPLFVSTTLYAVQREAMLPATFTLAGLIVFTSGRMTFLSTGGRSGLPLMATGLVVGTILAVLSKANGVLLPLLAGVLEVTLFQRHSLPPAASRRLSKFYVALIGVPAAVIAYQVIQPLTHLSHTPANRPWSIGERILTEPRVLMDYLQLLVVPRSVSTGLFNDSYPVSHGLLDPWTTLPAIVMELGVIILAVLCRRRLPVLSCALLFFFTGHLLESTTLPLELYFEHRNYLPAMLLFWPLADALLAWRISRKMRGAAAACILLLLAATTYQRSSLWGQPDRLATLWATINPGSARAQASAAINLNRSGRPDLALAQLEPQWRTSPYELQIAFNVVDARCRLGGLREQDRVGVQRALSRTSLGALMMTRWLEGAVEVASDRSCPGLDFDLLDVWIEAAQSNPNLGTAQRKAEDLEPVRALLDLRQHRPDEALRHFNLALRAHPTPDQAARNIVALASSGYFRQALAHLDLYESLPPAQPPRAAGMSYLHHRVLEWQGYWPNEMAILRSKLLSEIDGSRP